MNTATAPFDPNGATVESRVQTIADTLNDGVISDIWYDAGDHGEELAGKVIEETQTAMMAAAELLPDLLAALEALVFLWPGGHQRLIDAANAAIAKARGSK